MLWWKGKKCLHGDTNATDNYTFSMVKFLAWYINKEKFEFVRYEASNGPIRLSELSVT